jgi:hypothetical protein
MKTGILGKLSLGSPPSGRRRAGRCNHPPTAGRVQGAAFGGPLTGVIGSDCGSAVCGHGRARGPGPFVATLKVVAPRASAGGAQDRPYVGGNLEGAALEKFEGKERCDNDGPVMRQLRNGPKAHARGVASGRRRSAAPNAVRTSPARISARCVSKIGREQPPRADSRRTNKAAKVIGIAGLWLRSGRVCRPGSCGARPAPFVGRTWLSCLSDLFGNHSHHATERTPPQFPGQR